LRLSTVANKESESTLRQAKSYFTSGAETSTIDNKKPPQIIHLTG